MFSTLIHPVTKKKISIHSREGKLLLKHYKLLKMIGGAGEENAPPLVQKMRQEGMGPPPKPTGDVRGPTGNPGQLPPPQPTQPRPQQPPAQPPAQPQQPVQRQQAVQQPVQRQQAVQQPVQQQQALQQPVQQPPQQPAQRQQPPQQPVQQQQALQQPVQAPRVPPLEGQPVPLNAAPMVQQRAAFVVPQRAISRQKGLPAGSKQAPVRNTGATFVRNTRGFMHKKTTPPTSSNAKRVRLVYYNQNVSDTDKYILFDSDYKNAQKGIHVPIFPIKNNQTSVDLNRRFFNTSIDKMSVQQAFNFSLDKLSTQKALSNIAFLKVTHRDNQKYFGQVFIANKVDLMEDLVFVYKFKIKQHPVYGEVIVPNYGEDLIVLFQDEFKVVDYHQLNPYDAA